MRTLLLLFLCLMTNSAFSQEDAFGWDDDCLKRNCAVLAEAITECFDDSIVVRLLQKKRNIPFLIEVDSLGAPHSIRIPKDTVLLNKDQFKKIIQHIKCKHRKIQICYPNYDKYADSTLSRSEFSNHFKVNKYDLTLVVFPSMHLKSIKITDEREQLLYVKKRIKQILYNSSATDGEM